MEKDEEVFKNVIPSLSNQNFGADLNYDRYDAKEACSKAFPSDYTLAVLANLAYNKDCIPDLVDWEVLTSASDERITNGYRGVAFFNPKMCHVVVAHRGTDFLNPGAVYNDIKLALKSFEHQQAQSASSFAYLVAEEVKKVNKANDYKKLPFRFSITGHSLGAWLGQYSTFTVKYLTLNKEGTHFIRDDDYLLNIHPHTVVFESPGCRDIFEKLVEKLVYKYAYRKYGNYNTLDMTVYLNAPNPINCVNKQIGTIYMLPINSHSIIEMINYLAKDKVDKKVLLDMPSGIRSSLKQCWKWIVGSKEQRKLTSFLDKDDSCSLNVFTELELEFVKDIYRLYNSASIKTFRDKHDIPKFELIPEYNLLKGENFRKVILSVKNLQPDEQVVLNLLQDDVDDKVRFQLFKNDVESFENDLLDFNGYAFKDKYGFIDFFKSDKKILHVRVDIDSSIEYDFETNIIRNVITFYKNNPSFDMPENIKIAFIDWNKLSKFINELPYINYDLLVIEYFFENEKEIFLDFLKKISIKVVILTTNKISFKDSVNSITEVPGFGSTLRFGDLNIASQEVFLNRKIFKRNNQEISLNDLVKNIITNENENLLNNFPMVSVLELILADELSPIVLDFHFSNLLKSVLFYDLYDKIDHNNLLHNLDNSIVFVLPEDDTKVDLSNVFSNVNHLVDIDCHKEYEKKCFVDRDKTKYLITTKEGNIYLTSIFNHEFYINRSLIHKRSVNPTILKNTQDSLDSYIFYGDKKMFYKGTSSQQLGFFKFVLSEEKAIEIAKSSESAAHVLKINEDGTIDWRKSFGSVNSLYKYMQNKEVSIKEEDIMNDDQIIIISGEPGIGKSSVIEYLYLTLQSKYWIFPIQLKNCSFDGISDELTYDEVAKFVTKNCSYDAKSIQHILSFCLQYESKLPIYLMLDSFDEIVEDFKLKGIKKKVIHIINFLKLHSNVKILITTRPHLSQQLESGISVFASHFKPLNYDTEIVTFLVEFWKSHLCLFEKNFDKDYLTSIAENMLKSAKNTIGDTVSSFIEIPMNMRLLAETVTPHTYITSQFSDVLMLYHKYIDIRCDIYLKRFSLNPYPTVKKWLIESILGKMSALSMNQLLNVDIQQITDEEMEEFYKVGLIYLDSSNLNYKFLHDSVCDYFLSDSIMQWLTSQTYFLFGEYDVGKFLISELFLNEELKKVRLFLNFHLKTASITSKRIELCKNIFSQIWRDNISLLFNDDKESIFHICIKDNLIYLLRYFLVELLDSANATFFLTESNIRLETPLYYAISKTDVHDHPNLVVNCLTIFLNLLNNLKLTHIPRFIFHLCLNNPKPQFDVKEIFVATLFNYFITEDNLVTLNRYVKNFTTLETIMKEINLKFPLIKQYLNACQKNDLPRLTQILAKLDNDEITKTYLFKSTNELKETGIHLTSDIRIAEILVKPFNIDLQDHHGMTPLCRSIEEKRVDIAKMLILYGASYIRDDFGVTPLIYASKYNLFDIVKIIFKFKGKKIVDVNEGNQKNTTSLMSAARHGNKEIVTYLIEKTADIHLRDGSGLTAFHHAVRGRHTDIVKILWKKGSDINTRDRNGRTPLFYSVKHMNFDMIHSLLSKHADVNIGNNYGQYPLQHLIKQAMRNPRYKELGACLIMFLRKDRTPPAKTDMLSADQKEFIQKFLNLKNKHPEEEEIVEN